MIGTTNCVYETPCGWCSKWDKKCDKKMRTESYKINNPKSNKSTETTNDFSTAMAVNKICQSEFDHKWECCGISTIGTTYICKKCNAYKTLPCEFKDDIFVTI